jgi:hypothetical protein
MFTLQPKWLQNVYEYLLGVMTKRFTTSQRQYLAQKAKPFVLQEGVLCIFGNIKSFATKIGVHNFAKITWSCT